MNITVLLSVLLLIFSLYSIGERLVRFIRKEQGQSAFKLIATIFIWGGISYLAFFKLGSENNLNTFIFIGFVIVFFILFRLLSILEKNERLLTEIIRKDALKDLK
ncbi:MAG: hypothetical protein AAB876_01505 [Patescibacteria group bacterium]